ncbi:hypothetical protein L0Y97_07975 [Burkholderia multivorans]|uniref:hypothetical protein n=1 Tax=Burkholderia multivorans TaxID=87883 RepID=UPI001C2301B4|nr:hypothetical protein [Burkholderia multivorans]MBU9420044.1 hypothetical protein [Burkholderia multivorans]MCO1358848.1 hypothetical protein [Burkholderia multivorans]MCO1418676.1 hypothetical protein [Burkholderia multivorans]
MEATQTNQPADTHPRNSALSEEVRRIVRDANQHPTYPRRCLSCGAVESLDGSVPCGH